MHIILCETLNAKMGTHSDFRENAFVREPETTSGMKKPEQQPREVQNGLREAAMQQLSFPFRKNSGDKCLTFRILAHFYDIFKTFLVVHKKFDKNL